MSSNVSYLIITTEWKSSSPQPFHHIFNSFVIFVTNWHSCVCSWTRQRNIWSFTLQSYVAAYFIWTLFFTASTYLFCWRKEKLLFCTCISLRVIFEQETVFFKYTASVPWKHKSISGKNWRLQRALLQSTSIVVDLFASSLQIAHGTKEHFTKQNKKQSSIITRQDHIL